MKQEPERDLEIIQRHREEKKRENRKERESPFEIMILFFLSFFFVTAEVFILEVNRVGRAKLQRLRCLAFFFFSVLVDG